MHKLMLNEVSGYDTDSASFAPITADFSGLNLIGIVADLEETAVSLLRIIAGLMRPAAGEVLYDGSDIYSLTEEKRSKMMRKTGYIFDTGGLISNLMVMENVCIPYDFVHPGNNYEQKMERIRSLLHIFDIDENILQKRPSMLNKGEVKMINYVRTYAPQPEIVFIEAPLSKVNKLREHIVEQFILDLALGEGVTHFFAAQRFSSLVNYADAIIAIKKEEATFFKKEDDIRNSFNFREFFDLED
ncbi:MAG: ATP-binding cassette domain-containing protein [Ignavibacteriales bacterium]|nr:MAG: ATP-binding cassette domain-containing protein [Ignavibacteriaceae bacterium]MCZ2141866.1 ATP-binding cassette domain-containing protein [Ignavibacteriales bacterium]OQY70527.1 MAG: hypothetical protein B6D45_11070 [Ignavibacteriales bacterium UTCHB3]